MIAKRDIAISVVLNSHMRKFGCYVV
jgi:hypothetical protein